MTRARRTRLLLIAGGVYAAAVVALGAADGNRGAPYNAPEPPRVAGPTARTSAPVAERHESADPHGHDTRRGADERRVGRRVTRRFIEGLLRFQAMEPARTWERALADSATARVRRQVVGRRPRAPRNGPAPLGRVLSLELHGPQGGRLRATALIEYRPEPPSILDLELRRRPGGWRVSSLYR